VEYRKALICAEGGGSAARRWGHPLYDTADDVRELPMTDEMRMKGQTPEAGSERRVVTVGLVATPPDHPARVAEQFTRELPELLATRVDRDVRWEVRSGWGEVTPRRDGGAAALLDDVARRREGCGWDVAVCLTDLPLHARRMPLVAHCSARRRVGVVSLPALGLGQLRAGRPAIAGLVDGLLAADERSGRPVPDEQTARMVEDVAPIRRLVDDETDDGEVGFLASPFTGRLRLVAGMVRANRPGRALLGMSKLMVGAFGTAAFSLATNSIWQMGDALDGFRLTVIMLLSIAALVGWLVFTHHLWEKRSPGTPPELARLFNLGTVLTLGLAAVVSYAVLFAGILGVAALLIDASVLEQGIGHPVGLLDYLTLAWIISSMATVGGAIGSGLEDEEEVRVAAYGYHPTPGGWSDEQGPDQEIRNPAGAGAA
jgi:hypothetical protein